MKQEDEEKTAFHTNKGIFSYRKMPFGLKNAGATYQRLVDQAFSKQIGRNMEAYVDDLVIKSQSGKAMMRIRLWTELADRLRINNSVSDGEFETRQKYTITTSSQIRITKETVTDTVISRININLVAGGGRA